MVISIKTYGVGLMSGTSLDGVDVVLVEIEGIGKNTKINLVNSHFQSYQHDIRGNLLKLCQPKTATIDRICQMNAFLGRFFGEAVNELISTSEIPKEHIMFVASHGQTIYHIPEQTGSNEWDTPSTLQIGDISILSETVGLPVIGDFRPADIAVGGQGAPLVSYIDYLLFTHESKTRVVQNIGGIGNLTYLPPKATRKDVIAFDTGPGNMVIDALVEIITKGNQTFDTNGAMASKGNVSKELLHELNNHPYLLRPFPKTTGREEFGQHFVQHLFSKARMKEINDYDLLATVTAWTAKTIVYSYKQLEKHYGTSINEVVVSGGGCNNPTLLKYLDLYLPNMTIRKSDELGINYDLKEAMSFVILGHECLNGKFNNLPTATGATRQVIMGKVAFSQPSSYEKMRKYLASSQ